MIYLDNAATTPMHPEVIEAMTRSFREDYANSGVVYRAGLDARRKIEYLAEQIADLLRVPATHRILFTSGASESNNLFIKGLCFPDKKVASLGLEHPSIRATLDHLSSLGNPPVPLREFQTEGRLGFEGLKILQQNRVRLLCLSHVNNELGSVNEPASVVEAIRKEAPQVRLFLDGAQAVGKLPVAIKAWPGISGYSASAHKFQGPKGIGLLILDGRLSLTPQIHGGKQQYGVRSGTLPTPLIVGLAEALKIAVREEGANRDLYIKLTRRLVDGLKSLSQTTSGLKVRFNSLAGIDLDRQSPAIVNFSFPPVEGEVLLHHLEEQGIYVGLGSACSAHSKEPSQILTGIGLSEEEAYCSLRISFGPQNTLAEVDRFLDRFAKAYDSLLPVFRERKVLRK